MDGRVAEVVVDEGISRRWKQDEVVVNEGMLKRRLVETTDQQWQSASVSKKT